MSDTTRTTNMPLGQVIAPVVSHSLESPGMGHVAAEEIEQAIQRDRNGQIKIRAFSRQNMIVTITLSSLAVLTVYTMISMNYGKASFPVAINDAVSNFTTMMTKPNIDAHFKLADIVEGVIISLALSVLTTFIGALIAFLLSLLAAANLSNKLVSDAIKSLMSLFRAVPTILWVLIFTVAIGLGPEAAVCGMLF
ncbi:MAG: ABC transporter permease, partial [Coriobacteriia bacterium]|nr:ABC transporter permease [Coriobacteriia bacterium]